MNIARLLTVAPLVAALACSGASQANRTGATRTDPNVITSQELTAATQINLHSFVSAVRPRWLDARRPTNFDGRSVTVTVFLNGQRFGDLDQLRTMSPGNVREVRYYGTAEAQQRFSIQNLGAVINVITK